MPRSAAKGLDAKRPRACDSCRGLKVKCVIDPSSTDPCKRCAKAGRQCVVTPPTRKRQKKADSRVAELERKLDALTATLAQRDGKAPPPPEGGHAVKRDLDSYESSPVQSRSADSASSPAKRPRLDKVRGSVDSDERGLFSSRLVVNPSWRAAWTIPACRKPRLAEAYTTKWSR
jgi:hypothetical protein